GFTVGLMRNTGTGLAYEGTQWSATNLTYADTKFISGKFTPGAGDGFAYVTKNSDGGFSVAVFSSSASGISWQGVWWTDSDLQYDTTTFIPSDYDGDGLTDLFYATPDASG